ncbi:MAG TPA: hypothetical protein VGK19_14035 [Capsulimonadaceae bacterium]|jgi:hypothetical protein
MKKLTYIAVAGLAVLLAGLEIALAADTPAIAPPNLVNNPGFEEWAPAPAPPKDPKQAFPSFSADVAPARWNCVAEITPGVNEPSIKSSASVAKDETVKHSGKSSIRFINGATTDIIGCVTDFAVEPNTHYKVRMWVKGEGIVSNRNEGVMLWTRYGAKADFWSNNKWTVQLPPVHAGTFDWQAFEYFVDTNDNAELMHVTIQLRNASGKAWFDDIELVKAGAVSKTESY